jgi:hypothetical protein
MKYFIIGLGLFFCSCSETISFLSNSGTPCSCWKRSEYINHQAECNKAAEKMGLEEWDRKVEACKDFRLEEDIVNGYTKKDLVVINETWTLVYVK